MRRDRVVRVLFCVAAIAFLLPVNTQAQYTLDSCKALARANYPAIKRYSLIEKSRDYTVSNAAKAWLPQVSVAGNAAFFTDIMRDDMLQSSVLPDIKNSLYSGSVQLSQTIYDGGSISAQRRTARAQADVSMEQTNVTMYELNGRVEQIYFGILTLDEQIGQNALLQEDLAISMNTVRSMMSGGIANQSDIDAVSVEQVKARQEEEALRASRESYILMLSIFIGEPINIGATFAKPVEQPLPDGTLRRPELAYYAAKGRLLDAQRKALDADIMPRVSAFGLGIYHNRIVNYMENGMLAGGITLSWNIGALYTRKNDIRNIDIERQLNDVERETFVFNTSLDSQNSNGVIRSLQRQIALDDDIISLRQSIREKAEKKVLNGTETVNEMLRDVNAVSEARQTKALHTIQLLQEIYNLKNINNN